MKAQDFRNHIQQQYEYGVNSVRHGRDSIQEVLALFDHYQASCPELRAAYAELEKVITVLEEVTAHL
jgi:GrpB-like predicted nucleotidyltransferase (UPF0157 family)